MLLTVRIERFSIKRRKKTYQGNYFDQSLQLQTAQ